MQLLRLKPAQASINLRIRHRIDPLLNGLLCRYTLGNPESHLGNYLIAPVLFCLLAIDISHQ